VSESRVEELKSELGSSLVILGHHYQRDEVIRFADFRGDSLKLAREAARCEDARYIVFCGVHFMAETAAILAQEDQAVLLPDLNAGCPLADMAGIDDVERAWREIGSVLDVDGEVTPVTYVNSAAVLKAFCGEHGGSVCTSSNAAAVLEWALKQRERVLFFPDQHLGRNTAKAMGIPLEQMAEWDYSHSMGGNDADSLARAKVILWQGWCNVHQRFLPEDVTAWREREPGIRVVVHPECMMEVVDLADEAGSTAYIVRRVEESEPGAKWAIGTEANLVHRLGHEHPEQLVVSLSERPSYCADMNLITLPKVERILEGLARGELLNRITVEPGVGDAARLALDRMLEVSE
jgi:quinolinate synthase